MKFFRFLVGWWGAVARVVPPTPTDRTFIVAAETRGFIVEFEDRVFTP